MPSTRRGRMASRRRWSGAGFRRGRPEALSGERSWGRARALRVPLATNDGPAPSLDRPLDGRRRPSRASDARTGERRALGWPWRVACSSQRAPGTCRAPGRDGAEAEERRERLSDLAARTCPRWRRTARRPSRPGASRAMVRAPSAAIDWRSAPIEVLRPVGDRGRAGEDLLQRAGRADLDARPARQHRRWRGHAPVGPASRAPRRRVPVASRASPHPHPRRSPWRGRRRASCRRRRRPGRSARSPRDRRRGRRRRRRWR